MKVKELIERLGEEDPEAELTTTRGRILDFDIWFDEWERENEDQ